VPEDGLERDVERTDRIRSHASTADPNVEDPDRRNPASVNISSSARASSVGTSEHTGA
jgi:hypothetical protein